MDLSPDEDNFAGRLLHQAALWDNVELLQELLTSGCDVDSRDFNQRTALHAAALAERSRCLIALCDAGANPDAVSDERTGSKTALHIASERGHVENVRNLLGAGASLGYLDRDGNTPLALAERAGHRHAARALREARDALERERLSKHSELRDLVSKGDVQGLKTKLAAFGSEAGLIVNLTPGGANTLLYVASEAGNVTLVYTLLESGADGRAHPVTKYCPLYIACYRGHLEAARLLLVHYPEAVQQETVEKWLPIHAACIGGHPALVTLLLEYHYPEHLLNTYSDPTGQHKYKAAFDINACDVSGQTALYVACTLGNGPLVEALLAHFVTKLEDENEMKARQAEVNKVLSPQRGGISLGIHAIVSKLTGQAYKQEAPQNRIRPLRVDGGAAGDSCLAAAVRGAHTGVVRMLLDAGASADAPASSQGLTAATERQSRRRHRSSSSASGRSSTSPSPCRSTSYDDREGPWTALALAARAKNTQLMELLVSKGASDPQCRALRECVAGGLRDVVPLLLATKAYPDPDYKINRGVAWASSVARGDGPLARTEGPPAYAFRPATPVIVNWRELKCHCQTIRIKWLVDASLHVNRRLTEPAALHAITRLDVSNNDLRVLPPEIFTLYSLRHLNAAQNKLERLPTSEEPFEEDEVSGKKRKKVSKSRPAVYSAPVLQDVYLQDNRLETIPPELFSLPSLSTLDVSNNKLRALPCALWSARALKELNAALNHLRDLPGSEENTQEDTTASQLLSPTEPSRNGVSPSSGQNVQFDFEIQSKSSTRSPSIDHSIISYDEEDVVVLESRTGNASSSDARRVHTWRGVSEPTGPGVGAVGAAPGSPLQTLNLSHNQFTCVPPPLACRATSLQRLNMAYNSLRSMSYVTSYPTSLRQLDLSHNEITCWPSLPQVDSLTPSSPPPLHCYCSPPARPRRPRPAGPARAQLMSAACAARRHLRLDSLRTLILANNLLTRIQLTTDDDGYASETAEEDNCDDDGNEWSTGSSLKGRLLFPLLSMLDVSCNLLRSIPRNIHALSNLAVLNISGNKDITELPPQMGLLSRLWNLNTAGCQLQEPLASMLQCGKYRSMDIVGYLKSLLQEASTYAVMKLMLVGLQGIGKTSLLECLRHESAIAHRRKHTEHWAKRMGNKSTFRGNLSTVGVDIGTWVYEKQRSQRGPVTFRTWDFGGQQEYYATHQYFLSRRSLYLVVWKVTDGRKGLAGAIEWLRSIQARAPGSPVIMVATHYDQVANSNLPENESPEVLQRLIRTTIMGAPDADKLGLPRVLDSVEVSCSTKHNIRLLADIIYSVAFSVKPPGSKEPLLEQRIPASYLALEECVTHLANEFKEPVLSREEYKRLVTQYMQQKNHRMFRDAAEFHQATMFLHENGVLLHYDDATLKELYFLRPQWLCDVLAHVVTVKEINPFAANGIMKIDDLAHVFKASPALARGEEASSLGISLLNKFELALCWDARSLLVPPLLPKEEPAVPQLPLRTRSRSRGTPLRTRPIPFTTNERFGADSPTLIQEPAATVCVSGRNSGRALRRLLLLSYVPRGFWPRLVSRLLADDVTLRAAPYTVPAELELDEATTKALDLNWGWKLWQTGLALTCGDLVLLSVKELPSQCDELLRSTLMMEPEENEDHPYYRVKFRIRQDGSWCELDLRCSACVEILLPAHVCVARRSDGAPIAGYQSISIEPNPEILTKLLALVSDHVDLLLEDWYPSLGTRFVHTSEGRCLITRVVPCPGCLRDPPPPDPRHIDEALRRLELNVAEFHRPRVSEESRASDGDSGVGAESNTSSRLGSVDQPGRTAPSRIVLAWTVEQCLAAASEAAHLHCTQHGDVDVATVAPDALFLDVEEEKRARWEEISLGPVIGRGAFGVVHAATWRGRGVALKALQPVEPRDASDRAAKQAYKAALSRWERAPGPAACRAYCALRQELSILQTLKHAHVAPALAVCARPLALLLRRAPQGALDAVIRSARGTGARFGARVLRLVALQVARALEYLHARRIVYRDLKSENVLVWSLPPPQDAAAAERSANPLDVHVKLGDYGISRLALPSGTKGFGGTEGFMAPEIMRYNGEEEYNEKVDCFSYGMLLYEMLTLRQPFEGHEAVKEAVLDGTRPSLTPRDLQYPCCMLETMRRCWGASPDARPSAAALVCLCAAPEFTTLYDVAVAPYVPLSSAAAATSLYNVNEEGAGGWEVYRAGEGGRVHALLATSSGFTRQHTFVVPPDRGAPVTVTAMCSVGSNLWLADTAGRICVYSASSLSFLWSVNIEDMVGGAPAAVAALLPLPAILRVAVAMTCGRLFLVTSQKPEAEGTFVLTELGTATELSCLAAVPIEDGYSLWAGGDGLACYSVGAGGVCGAENIADAPPISLLTAATPQRVAGASKSGSCVYQWCCTTLQQMARLDCGKLAPCSESLQSLTVDEARDPDSSKVTSLASARAQLFVGTAGGCVVVAEADSLRPITVVRPYERCVSAILPLYPHKGTDSSTMLATLGSGYRPLVQRFLPQTNSSNTQTNTSTEDYCMLWKVGPWLPD